MQSRMRLWVRRGTAGRPEPCMPSGRGAFRRQLSRRNCDWEQTLPEPSKAVELYWVGVNVDAIYAVEVSVPLGAFAIPQQNLGQHGAIGITAWLRLAACRRVRTRKLSGTGTFATKVAVGRWEAGSNLAAAGHDRHAPGAHGTRCVALPHI